VKIDSDNVLHCPFCDFDYLHQFKVEVFDRVEDSITGYHATIEAMGVIIDSDMKNNPSGRRDGVKVWFYCEGCDKVSFATIIQHKGRTFIEHHATAEKYGLYQEEPCI